MIHSPPEGFTWNARQVAALRRHVGCSQAKLAKDMGIRQQTISEWETGMYAPKGVNVTILTLIAVSSGFQYHN